MNSPITRYFRQSDFLRRVGLLHGNFLYMIDYARNGEMSQSIGMLKTIDDKLVEAQASNAVVVIVRRLPLCLVRYDEAGERVDSSLSSIEMLQAVHGQWRSLDRKAIQLAFERDRRLKLITPLDVCRRFVEHGYQQWVDIQSIHQSPSTTAA